MAQAIAPSTSDRPDAARTGDVPAVVKADPLEARQVVSARALARANRPAHPGVTLFGIASVARDRDPLTRLTTWVGG